MQFLRKFPGKRLVTKLSHKEDRAEAQIVFEPAERLIAHEQDREGIHFVFALEKIPDRGPVDHGCFDAEFLARPCHTAFGMGENGWEVVLLQQRKGTAVVSHISIAHNLPITFVNNSLPFRDQPAMDRFAHVSQDLQIDAVYILEMNFLLHGFDVEICCYFYLSGHYPNSFSFRHYVAEGTKV